MSGDAIGGTCKTCGQDLVHIFGGRTYHPWDQRKPCSALLLIPGTELVGSDVPFNQFAAKEQIA